MTLTKELLTKSLKKGRMGAVALLQQLSRAGGLPEPVYEHETGQMGKRTRHFCRVRFRVPSFLSAEESEPSADNLYRLGRRSTVSGSGRCTNKAYAKSLAALEVLIRLEEVLEVGRGSLAKSAGEYTAIQKIKQEELEAVPVTQELPGVSWTNIPVDAAFSETLPAGRRGRIDFLRSLVHDTIGDAFMAAKAITLTSRERLPEVTVHANHTAGEVQRYANVRAIGLIEGVVGAMPDELSYGLDPHQAVVVAMQCIGVNLRKRLKKDLTMRAVVAACERKESSFGMAKLYVNLPKHQFKALELLLEKVQDYQSPISQKYSMLRQRDHGVDRVVQRRNEEFVLQARRASLRAHQARNPLPIDSVETAIPHGTDVTIVRGGTGSGSTCVCACVRIGRI